MAWTRKARNQEFQGWLDGNAASIGEWYAAASLDVLQDIRSELRELNALLHCQNFTGIPTTLRSIRRAMPARKKAAKR